MSIDTISAFAIQGTSITDISASNTQLTINQNHNRSNFYRIASGVANHNRIIRLELLREFETVFFEFNSHGSTYNINWQFASPYVGRFPNQQAPILSTRVGAIDLITCFRFGNNIWFGATLNA